MCKEFSDKKSLIWVIMSAFCESADKWRRAISSQPNPEDSSSHAAAFHWRASLKKKKIAYQKHSWRTTGYKIEAGQPPHAEDIRYFWLSVIKRSILDGKADFYHPNLLSFFCIAQSWAKALKKKEYQEKNPWCKIFLCFLHPVSVKLTQHFKKRSIMVKHGGGSVMSGVALLREDLNNSS